MSDERSDHTYAGVADLLAEVAAEVDPSQRLPNWPFRRRWGRVAICEYAALTGGRFTSVLQGLAEAYGDEHVTLAVLEPDLAYYERAYSHAGAFRVDVGSLSEAYPSGLHYEPQGDVGGALAHSARVLGLTGSSHQWSIWGQQDWEFGLLLTPDRLGPWLNAGIPFFGPRDALHDISPPRGWGHPVSDDEATAFLQTIDAVPHDDDRPRSVQWTIDYGRRPSDIDER